MAPVRPEGSESASEGGNRFDLARDNPAGEFSVWFEDDGETGYLCLFDLRAPEPKIREALWIYNTAPNVREQDVDIEWTADGRKAALKIMGRIWAIVDAYRSQRCSVPYREGEEPALLPDMLEGF